MDSTRCHGDSSRHGLSRAVAACAVLLCLAGALLVAGQAAARSSKTNAQPKLTPAERRAVGISSVSSVADPSFGVVVTVKFTGDIERYFGQGDLTAGLLALGISPKVSAVVPAELVAAGGGYTEQSVPVVTGAGHRLRVKQAALELFGTQHVVRTGAGGGITLVRANNQLVLFLPSMGLAQPANVQLEVFAKSPPGVGRPPTAFHTLTASRWQKIVHDRPTVAASSTVTPSQLTVAQLQTLQGQVSRLLSATLEPELRKQTQARAGLRKAIDDYSELGGKLSASRASLLASYHMSAATITHLKTQVTQAQKLVARLTAQLAAAANPPVSVVQTDVGLDQELSSLPGLVTSRTQPQGVPIIHVDPTVRYQSFSGVGAAMPDSSAWLIDTQLPAAQRAALMQALFGAPGSQNALGVPAIHLNFLRVGIGAAGAMTVGAPYSYDDMPAGESDPTLSNFSISRDLAYIIPTVQQALQVNPGMQILANPWSPPGWMKSNDALGNPNGQATLLPSAYAPLAQYFVKFIQAYQSNGVPINAITPQNEPSSGQVGTAYPGLTLPEPNEEQFISQDLAPALRAAGLNPKIYGNDLSWDSSAYAQSLADGSAAGQLAGIAWHCYFGSPAVMAQLHQSDPSFDQIVSECSPEIRGFGTPEFLISSLRNWASEVSAWSVALDPNGGPIQPGNDCPGCRGPVTIDEQSQTVTFRPEYFQLGQVSDFVQPGATRIGSESFVSYGLTSGDVETVTPGLDDVAFLNPDGSKALVAYNNSGAATTFAVQSGGQYFTYTLPGHAMATLTWH
jgi:glucosylceramidase